jgi:uncharacterized membrane protein YgcG
VFRHHQQEQSSVKHIVLVLAFVLMTVNAWAYPRIQNPVEDYADVLTTAQENEISNRIQRVLPRAHVAVLTVTNTNGEPIEDFSHAVAEQWRGGSAELSNGVLVVLSVGTHKSRIEVGSGLESVLTDTESRTLLENARPSLRNSDYRSAILGIVNGIDSEVGAPVGSPAAPVSPVASTPLSSHGHDDGSGDVILFLIAFLGIGGGLTWWMIRRTDRSVFADNFQYYEPPTPTTYVRARTPTPVPYVSPVVVVAPSVPAVDIEFHSSEGVQGDAEKILEDGAKVHGDLHKVLGDLNRVTSDLGPVFGDLNRVLNSPDVGNALETFRRKARDLEDEDRREEEARIRRQFEDNRREQEEEDRRARRRREEDERRRREDSYTPSVSSSSWFSSSGSGSSSSSDSGSSWFSSSSDSGSSWSDSGGSFDGGGSSSDW